MHIVPIVELSSVVFVVYLLVGQFIDNEKTKSLKLIKVFLFEIIGWLIIDAVAELIEGPSAITWMLWLFNFISSLMRPVTLITLAFCADAYLQEHTEKCSKWWFTAPAIILGVIGLGYASDFIAGFSGRIENGVYNELEIFPIFTLIIYVTFIAYSSIVMFIFRKKIATRASIVIGFSFLPTVISLLLLYIIHLDFTPIATALFAVLVCGSLQRLNIKKKTESLAIKENNERMLVLEDDFEILYEVDLSNNFSYVSFTKDNPDSPRISKDFVYTNNFFVDVIRNSEGFIYEEDEELFKKSMSIDFIRNALEKSDHYDFIYRLKIGDQIKWKRTRIVYKNSQKNSLIIGAFDSQETMMKKIEEEQTRNQLIQSMIGDDALFIINLEKNTRETLRNVTPEKEKFLDSEPFSSALSRYIDTYVIDYDKKKVRDMTSLEYIKKRLDKVPEYSFKFRDISSGAQRFYEMRFAKFNNKEVLMSVTDKDVYILTKSILEKFKDAYFSMFAFDTDEGYVHILKDDVNKISFKSGDVVDCKEVFNEIANKYEKDTAERRYFEKISDAKFLKQKLLSQDLSSTIIRFNIDGEKKWAMSREMVLSRDMKTGEPAIVAIVLNYLDKEERESEIMRERLKEDMTLIGGLADEYKAMFYINIDEDVFKIREVDKNLANVINSHVNQDASGIELMSRYVNSPLVHPDDRDLFKNFGPNFLREKLKNNKKYVVRFRLRNEDNTYSWYEIKALKAEKENERANIIIMTCEECSEEVRKERLLQQCFDIANKEIPSLNKIQQLLALVSDHYGARRACVCEISKIKDTVSVTYEWDADDVKEQSLQHLEIPLKEFEPWIVRLKKRKSVLISEDDSDERVYPIVGIFKRNGFKQVALSPILNSGELVGFIGLDIPTSKVNELISARTVANVIYSEILKHKESDEEHVTLNKVTSSFATVYFVDLARDYAHNWKLDKEYRYTDENVAISKFSESFGAYIDFCIAPEEKERCHEQISSQYILEQFKTKPIFSINMKDISKGTPMTLAFDFIKVNDDGSQFVVCSRDITEILAKENEQKQKLQEALDLADSANKAKTSFLFNMSHDIRTPMNAILGFTNMAMKNTKDENKLMDCLRKAQQSGNMLVSLINNVLEVSRIESGHAKVEEKPVDAFKSFRSVDSTMLALAKSKDIDIKFEFGKYENRYAYGDVIRCSRIFVNIISNAIKYTPNGGKVNIKCEQVTFGDDVCIYRSTISDNGIGMSEEFQKHIFEQFTREANTTLSGVEGTGLGMTVVKSFVDLLGGKISFTSKKDVGTTFVVELPFRIQKPPYKYYDPESGQILEVGATVEEEENKNDFTGKKVLLVEDNMLNAEITTEILQDEGFIVEHASNGQMAVDFIKEKGLESYDIVLMDIQMPVMNGYEATKIIRELYSKSKTPIIALSANAFQEDKEQSLAAGMNDHVAKPIDIKQLLAVIARFFK
ncbi:MAG: response regulator [Bacilli bacterium]|nr:response regulator [Bacilli bacterium]